MAIVEVSAGQAEDQRDRSSRQPVLDRDEHAAEAEAVHHQAGDRAVRHTARARPFRPGEREYRAKQHHDDAHAQRQERQRFGISEPKLGANNARSPQHDEYAGRREYDEVLQSARHERGHPELPNAGTSSDRGSRQRATRTKDAAIVSRQASGLEGVGL